jgi:hypothetical protein
MNQSARTGVPVFADTTARDAAFGGSGEKTLAEGQLAYLEDTNVVQFYDGAAWSGIGKTVQQVNTQTGAVATGTTIIPQDDTIPQNTEGDEYMTLSITPKNASNILFIQVDVLLSNSASNALSACLFQDSTANALASTIDFQTTATGVSLLSFNYTMTAGTTSATTFKVRAGGSGAGTTTFNGSGGARLHGGVLTSSITITEYTP